MAIPPQFAKFIAAKSGDKGPNPLANAAAARLAHSRTKKRPKKKKGSPFPPKEEK